MENVNVMTAVSDTAVENTKSKHKWLAKGSRFAKKAILTATVMSSMAAMCTTQAFAATGEVDTSSFLFQITTMIIHIKHMFVKFFYTILLKFLL